MWQAMVVEHVMAGTAQRAGTEGGRPIRSVACVRDSGRRSRSGRRAQGAREVRDTGRGLLFSATARRRALPLAPGALPARGPVLPARRGDGRTLPGVDTGAVVVAVIAAVASIVAAVLASSSSRKATGGARDIADRNHQVARLDRDAEQLRADFAAFVVATGLAHDAEGQSRLIAADLVLGANPRCGEALRHAADEYTWAITTALKTLDGRSGTMTVERHFEALRAGFVESMAQITVERSVVLAGQPPEHATG